MLYVRRATDPPSRSLARDLRQALRRHAGVEHLRQELVQAKAVRPEVSSVGRRQAQAHVNVTKSVGHYGQHASAPSHLLPRIDPARPQSVVPGEGDVTDIHRATESRSGVNSLV